MFTKNIFLLLTLSSSFLLFSQSTLIFLSQYDIANGYETQSEGEEIVLQNSLTVDENATIASTVPINTVNKTNVLISIKHSNTILDLHGQSIKTNKDSLITIAIADNISNVVIKNGIIDQGTSTFDSAIIIGQFTSSIYIENLTIIGCSGSDGSINFKGTSTFFHNIVTLCNIRIYKSTALGINCQNARNLIMRDITYCSNTVGSTINMINLDGCNSSRINYITMNNNKGTSGTTGLRINNCRDISVENALFSNNTDDTAGGYTTGIIILNSKHIDISQADISYSLNALYGISITTSQSVFIDDTIINSCESGNTANFIGIFISNSQTISSSRSSISNNIADQKMYGIKAQDATNKNISIYKTDIKSNTATNDSFYGFAIDDTDLVEINECEIIANTGNGHIHGVQTKATVSELHVYKTLVISNVSTSTATGNHIAGMHITGTLGVIIKDCISNRNRGTGKVYGYHIEELKAAQIDNCLAIHNSAAINIADAKPSAGFFFDESSFCIMSNSRSIYNRAGNHAPGTGSSTVNFTTACAGAGIMNIGLDANNPNLGNEFINCKFNGNGTQHGTTDPGAGHHNYQGANYRYWPSQAYAAGMYEKFTSHSIYSNCDFSNNGLSDYVEATGAFISDGVKNIYLEKCIAANNRSYGFLDENAFSTTCFMGCISITNGTNNAVAIVVESDEEVRNVNATYEVGKNGAFEHVDIHKYVSLKGNDFAINNFTITKTGAA